jgi:transposase InsO family protein
MSAPKYKLKELLPSLVLQARTNSDAEVKSRFKFLKAVAESPKSVRNKCREEGKSHQLFYKWAKVLLRTKDLLSLKGKSRKPKRSPNKTSKRVARKIRVLRKLEPFSGPERISQDLDEYHSMKCPPSTVYRVLKREGLISKAGSKSLTKRHLKRYRRPLPGYLQMDFKYVPYKIEGKQFYQLSAVDHHSSWRFIRIFSEKSEASVIDFLEELRVACPFLIMQIQTDNDTAFTDKFSSKLNCPTGRHAMDIWCEINDIEHRLIPVGQKELNGKVENTHKQDDREFFSQIRPLTLQALRMQSLRYNDHWNARRKTRALSWQTPNEVVLAAPARAYVYLRLFVERFAPKDSSIVQLNADGNMILQTNEKPLKPPKKPKRISVVSRYLQYLDWDDKRRLKAFAPLVAMSQNFSRAENTPSAVQRALLLAFQVLAFFP